MCEQKFGCSCKGKRFGGKKVKHIKKRLVMTVQVVLAILERVINQGKLYFAVNLMLSAGFSEALVYGCLYHYKTQVLERFS